MHSIIGQSFSDYVTDQINVRQTKLSLDEKRNDQVLKYISNKTSFVRLASSVDIDTSNPDYQNSAAYQNLKGISGADDNTLAKKHVLEGARAYTQVSVDIIPSSSTAPESININTDVKPLGGAGYKQSDYPLYGWLASTDSGLVPPPGITSVEVKSLNRGSLREATVNIVCHNLQQFKVIDALYLRLKYTMLLEWGHTLYFNNSGALNTSDQRGILAYFLNKSANSYEKYLSLIEDARRIASGNYDAMLGQVKNFEWTLREDGGYDIVLYLISVGDVIESLKVNTNYPGLSSAASFPYTPPAPGDEPPVLPSTIANKNKSTLNQILYALSKKLEGNSYSKGNIQYIPLSELTSNNIVSITNTYSQYALLANYTSGESTSSDMGAIGVNFESLSVDTEGDPESGALYYIKLGALCQILQAFLLKYDTKQSKKPLFFIDYDYDKNLCLTVEDQFSTDPRVCLLKPKPNTYAQSGIFFDGKKGNLGNLDDNFRISGNEFFNLGKFMHIYVNLNFISSTLENSIDNDGKASIYDFLTNLMKGIQSATGCINDYEVTFDNDTNYLVIRDNNLPAEGAKYLNIRTPTLSKFNTHLLSDLAGCFVLDAQLKTELNNKFASIISIGAQANGNQVGENATALSKLNTGYVDRIVPSRTSAKDEAVNSSGDALAFDVYSGDLQTFIKLINQINDGSVTTDAIDNGTRSISDYYKFKLGYLTNSKQISGVGFIPLSLQLKMDGLSGMKIYEVYTTDDTVLPPLYKSRVQFIIKGITHRIDPTSGWVTTIESLAGPKPLEVGETAYTQYPYIPFGGESTVFIPSTAPFVPVSITVPEYYSPLRAYAVEEAVKWYNKNIVEIKNDTTFSDPSFSESLGRLVGWRPGSAYCNYSIMMWWKYAYESYIAKYETEFGGQPQPFRDALTPAPFGYSPSEIAVYNLSPLRAVNQFIHNNWRDQGKWGPVQPFVSYTFNNMKSLNHAVLIKDSDWYLGKTLDPLYCPSPGDCITFRNSEGTRTHAHISMIVSFDPPTGNIELIHGNYSQRIFYEKFNLKNLVNTGRTVTTGWIQMPERVENTPLFKGFGGYSEYICNQYTCPSDSRSVK